MNFDRRQLAYPIPERFIGIGTETRDVQLPRSFGVPMERGQHLAIYASWHNDTGRDLDEVWIRVAMDYTSKAAGREVRDVLPVYLDTNKEIGGDNMFDIPPGESSRSWEFTVPVSGDPLGASGHLHDYGKAVRLEDAETGEVLFEQDGITDRNGKILGVERRVFRKWLGLRSNPVRLEADHRYRVVGVYDSPLSDTVEDGAMAHIVAVFAPRDISEWPALDPENRWLKVDVEELPPRIASSHH